ncbi:hypothetical protein Ciccas_003396 [Cichlidogyrus casuarinus]|uniref:Rho-GAP domain-containing protein n=1 Tax=Cichlidogyrus casuarinus TaxID=1844966 RepID=A0ABD2QEJ0_9PLAT
MFRRDTSSPPFASVPVSSVPGFKANCCFQAAPGVSDFKENKQPSESCASSASDSEPQWFNILPSSKAVVFKTSKSEGQTSLSVSDRQASFSSCSTDSSSSSSVSNASFINSSIDSSQDSIRHHGKAIPKTNKTAVSEVTIGEQLASSHPTMYKASKAHLSGSYQDDFVAGANKKKGQQILKGFAQLLLKTTSQQTSNSSAPSNPKSSPCSDELARIQSLLSADPASLSHHVDLPGMIFGCPLVQQTASAKYPVGFSDVDMLANLGAWGEVNALTGLIKMFTRRLPDGLFDLSRFCLCLCDFFGTALWNPVINAMPADSSSIPHRLEEAVFSVLFRMYNQSLELNNNQADEENRPSWRWHTLRFMMQHLRSVVALENYNSMSAQSLAICLGPVFFNSLFDGTQKNHVDILPQQVNRLVELLLINWDTYMEKLGEMPICVRRNSPASLDESSPVFGIQQAKRRGTCGNSSPTQEELILFSPRRPTTATCSLVDQASSDINLDKRTLTRVQLAIRSIVSSVQQQQQQQSQA